LRSDSACEPVVSVGALRVQEDIRPAMKRLLLMLATMLSTWGAVAAETWNHPPKTKTAGLEHRTFRSESMRAEVGYNICLPPEYTREPRRRFPVIYYLHGYEGNESSFLDYAKFWRESLARTGPSLLVFVNGGETSFFSDAPDKSVMGESVVTELVRHIDAQFRTQADARHRSLHGYSMGGFGALKIAFKHPDLFGSVVAYGATLSDVKDFQKHLGKVYKQMFGTTERFDANNPLVLAERNAQQLRGHVDVLIVIGIKDEFLNANRELHDRLNAQKIANDFIEVPGAKHAKEALYERAAPRAFEFTGRIFTAAKSTQPREEKKTR
jgi:S-formylglutathione hydrolase FrmB